MKALQGYGAGERLDLRRIQMRHRWANKHLAEAVEVLFCELTKAPGMIEPQEDLLSRGRINGIGPKVMRQAAAKLGIVFERHVRPDLRRSRTYWRLPNKGLTD